MAKRKSVYVPFYIITEIFLRLPCKSLARFKTVCKQWRSNIDDVLFVSEYNDYRRRNATNPSYFLSRTSEEIRDCETNVSRTCRKFHLWGIGRDSYSHLRTLPMVVPESYEAMSRSSNGLVCLHGVTNRRIAVLNPTTEEIIALPDFPKPYVAFERRLAGDIDPCPVVYHNLLGFGFHRQSHKYKVVQLVYDSCTGRISWCYVLTVRRAESTWTAVESSRSCQPFRHRIRGEAVCANGVLYWECYHVTACHGTFALHHIEILAFDLGTEKMKIIVGPSTPKPDVWGPVHLFTELNGSLCFVEYDEFRGLLQMNISMLDDSGDRVDWTHTYRLELGPYHRNGVYFFYPICIRQNRILLHYDRAFYVYDVEEKVLRVYHGPEILWKSRAVMYDEALVLLN